MKKLSIVALVLSIISLIISIYVWTGGFSGAGTFIGRTTPVATTPAATTTREVSPISSIDTGDSAGSTISSLSLTEGAQDTLTLKTIEGADAFTFTITPVFYDDGASKILLALRVTGITINEAAAPVMRALDSLVQPALTDDSALTIYAVALEDAFANRIDLEAASSDLRKQYQKILASSGSQAVFPTLTTDSANDFVPFVVTITDNDMFSGVRITEDNQQDVANFIRRFYIKLSAF